MLEVFLERFKEGNKTELLALLSMTDLEVDLNTEFKAIKFDVKI